MANIFTLPLESNKENQYQSILDKIGKFSREEKDELALLVTIVAVLKRSFSFLWVGFYLSQNNELRLGPFQGPVACTRIQYGDGVCGTAFKEQKTMLVNDVDQFPGHIACSPDSKSEIVVPVIVNNKVKMVLDIDSDERNYFDATDQQYLEEIARLIGKLII